MGSNLVPVAFLSLFFLPFFQSSLSPFFPAAAAEKEEETEEEEELARALLMKKRRRMRIERKKREGGMEKRERLHHKTFIFSPLCGRNETKRKERTTRRSRNSTAKQRYLALERDRQPAYRFFHTYTSACTCALCMDCVRYVRM